MQNIIKIKGSGSYIPSTVVTNDDLAKIMDTSDEWIQSHIGIQQRHFALNENTSDLATKAAQDILSNANVKAEDVDLIIVSTMTPDALTPATAAIVQKNIGANNAFAYDISSACSGFVFAMSTAEKFLRSAQYKTALVIGAENNSKMLDFKDRTTAVFFGDGAAGVLLQKSDEGQDVFISEKLCTQGETKNIHSGRVQPISQISIDNYPKLDAFYQNGRAVFNFVTSEVVKHMAEFIDNSPINKEDIDLVITHQVNLRLIENISQQLDIPLDKFGVNVVENGNTSSAGIPLVLNDYLRQHKGQNKTLLLTGFGAGLAYGSLLLRLS